MAFRRNKADPALEAGKGAGGELDHRPSELRVHRPAGPEPLPDAKPMPLGGPATRDICWARLPGRAAARLTESAGERIEWWATMPAGTGTAGLGWVADTLPRAVVFGGSALCFAEPRVDSAHRPVYSFDRYVFDPDSHRRAEVIFAPPRPAPDAAGNGAGQAVVSAGTANADASIAPVQASAGPVPVAVPGLGPAAVELIGNLPVRAQKLLTAPFGAAHPVQRCDWYYEGSANRFTVFAVVLVGGSQATLAHGSRVIPVGHDDRSSHWSLICRRAAVLRHCAE